MPEPQGTPAFGRYRDPVMLGSGGMGAVYEATDLRLNRKAAVKVIGGQFFGNSEALRRFEREAQTAARLTHPNIITIYDYGVLSTEGAYLVMELVEGPVSFVDTRNNKRDGKAYLKPVQTVINGVPFGRPYQSPFAVR